MRINPKSNRGGVHAICKNRSSPFPFFSLVNQAKCLCYVHAHKVQSIIYVPFVFKYFCILSHIISYKTLGCLLLGATFDSAQELFLVQ